MCRGGRTVCNAAKVVKSLGIQKVLFCVAHTEVGMGLPCPDLLEIQGIDELTVDFGTQATLVLTARLFGMPRNG